MPESQGIPSLGNTFQWMKKATRLDRTYESVNEAINVIHLFFFLPSPILTHLALLCLKNLGLAI